MRYLLTALCLFAACAGCGGSPQLSEGTVTGKHYHSAWTEVRVHTIYVDDDTTISTPYTVEHPEWWELVVADDEGRARRIECDQSTYHKSNRGDWWSEGGGTVEKGKVEEPAAN